MSPRTTKKERPRGNRKAKRRLLLEQLHEDHGGQPLADEAPAGGGETSEHQLLAEAFDKSQAELMRSARAMLHELEASHGEDPRAKERYDAAMSKLWRQRYARPDHSGWPAPPRPLHNSNHDESGATHVEAEHLLLVRAFLFIFEPACIRWHSDSLRAERSTSPDV